MFRTVLLLSATLVTLTQASGEAVRKTPAQTPKKVEEIKPADVRLALLACLRALGSPAQVSYDKNKKQNFGTIGKWNGDFGLYYFTTEGSYFVRIPPDQLEKKLFALKFTLPGVKEAVMLQGTFTAEDGSDLVLRGYEKLPRATEVEALKPGNELEALKELEAGVVSNMKQANNRLFEYLPPFALGSDEKLREWYQENRGTEDFTKLLAASYRKALPAALDKRAEFIISLSKTLEAKCEQAAVPELREASRKLREELKTEVRIALNNKYRVNVKDTIYARLPAYYDSLTEEKKSLESTTNLLHGFTSEIASGARTAEDWLNEVTVPRSAPNPPPSAPTHQAPTIPAPTVQ